MKQGTDNNGFFSKLAKWFSGIGYGPKAGIISGAALIVCCLIAGIWYFSAMAGQTPPVEEPSSQASSLPASSKETSSKEVSSKPVSSEEVSSEEVSSEPVSSEAVSSEAASKASSAAALPTISTEVNSNVTATTTPTLPAFDEILKSNKDVVGQIYLAGTKLNYYVTQTTNNTYYLTHDVYKNYNSFGTLFADFRCTISPNSQSTNIVIYGHSDDKNGTYLSAIKNYKDLAFYQAHPTITFNTIYGNGTYKVIGMFLENVNTSKSFGYHNFIVEADSFNTGTGLDQFVAQVKGRSYLSIPVDVQSGDHLITLSTCMSTTSQNSRYVLVARKVREGEDASVDTSAATVNSNMIPASGPLN